MKITYGNILQVKLKYVYERPLKDGTPTLYYQRKIPLDLLDRYDTRIIKEPLRTYDFAKAAKLVKTLNQKYEAIWSAMRENPSAKPAEIRLSAIDMLSRYGLKPNPSNNHEENLDKFIREVLEPKAIQYAQGDEETFREAHPIDYLSHIELEALKLLNVKPEPMLSDALTQYLNYHKKSDDEDFRQDSQRVWDKLLSFVGDKPIAQTNRDDARTFINKRLAEGVKTGTVRRNLRGLHAIFAAGLLEYNIVMVNPFGKINIANEGFDTEARETFDEQQLITLAKGCKSINDDMRWALAMQMDLGSRIGEIVGLTLDDIVLDHETPHVNFEPKPWRSIKNDEKRLVPLVGVALWAAKCVKQSAKHDQFFAFPRYNQQGKDGKTNKDSASAALNKYMRNLGLDKTTHVLRHTMRDRLRNANAIGLVMDAIGGWGKQNIGETYGQGYALKILHEWMSKVAFDV